MERHQPNPWRQGITTTTAAYLAVGVSAFVILASSPRLLGASGHSVLAVAWTTVTVFGIGLANPAQRQIVQSPLTSAGSRRFLLTIAALGVTLPAASAFGVNPLLSNSVLWAWSVVVGFFGWALAAPARGRLVALQDYQGVSRSLWAEAIARAALVLSAWLAPAPDLLLAAAIGVPILLSWLVARSRVSRLDGDDPVQRWPVGQFVLLVLGAAGAQLTLNAAPLWLAVYGQDDRLAGAFVTANSYLRIPMMASAGVGLVAIGSISRAWEDGRPDTVADHAKRATAGAAVLSVGGVGLLYLLRGPGLEILYGADFALPPEPLGWLAVGASAALFSAVLTQVLLGTAGTRTAATIWCGAAIALALTLVLAAPSTTGIAIATAVALLGATALIGLSIIARLKRTRGA